MRPAFIVLCVLTLAAVGPAQADEQGAVILISEYPFPAQISRRNTRVFESS